VKCSVISQAGTIALPRSNARTQAHARSCTQTHTHTYALALPHLDTLIVTASDTIDPSSRKGKSCIQYLLSSCATLDRCTLPLSMPLRCSIHARNPRNKTKSPQASTALDEQRGTDAYPSKLTAQRLQWILDVGCKLPRRMFRRI